MMLFFWGIENFNLWIFLFAIPGIFSFFQLSITGPIRNEMYRLFKINQIKKIKYFYHNSFFIVLINIFLISIISLIYFFINKNFVINYPILVLIVFAISFLTLINSNAYSLLTFKGDYSVYIKIEIFYSLIIAFVIPLSFLLFNDFETTFFLRFFFELLKTITLFFNCKNIKFKIILSPKFIDLKYIKLIIKLSLGYTFDILSNLIKGPGIIFIIGLYNLNLVGLVSTSRTLFYYLPLRFLNILDRSFYLEFNNLLNTKKLKKQFSSIYKKLLIVLGLIMTFHIITSLILGEYIYSFWINEKFIFNFDLVILIVLDSIITAFGIFLILPFKSIHQNNTPAMIELAINLVFYLIIIFINSKDIILIFKLLLFSSCMIFIVKLFYSIKLYKKYAN